MKTRIVIQARTSSTRLPGKVLKSIGGMPLALLVAQRASRCGHDVIVATSTESSDDQLAGMLAGHGISVFRGSLSNVLGRFVSATIDMDDSDVCVRLTADNPVPDGEFIELALQRFKASDVSYLSYGNDGIFIPYGLSVEVFRVGALRRSLLANPDAETSEHVTTMIKSGGSSYLRPALPDFPSDLGHLRCTVDTAEDFGHMSDVFESAGDPVHVGWRQLVDRMIAHAPRKPSAQPVLGTVQLGMSYGRANQVGMPSAADASDILACAYKKGLRVFDTARDYGESESRIGEAMRGNRLPNCEIITKLTPRVQQSKYSSPAELGAFVENEVGASLEALGLPQISTLLLHRTSDLDYAEGAIWRKLLELKSAGLITNLGCSVQTPAELQRALAEPEVHAVQLPFNLLDWRWEKSIAGLRFRPDVQVHVRSAFLQGLLVCGDADIWPKIDNLDAGRVVKSLQMLANRLGRRSTSDLCLAYIRAMSWVSGIVVGVESVQQAHETFDLWNEPCLTWDEVAQVRLALPLVPEQLLNPALWPAG